MSRITIREADLTRLGVTNLSSEVVYVPGFVTADSDYLDSTTVDKNIPTLCNTIEEFEAFFGHIPAVFAEDQPYPEGMFSENAVPASGIMFTALDVDPSYVYARELINAGIPVLYERMNGGAEDITVANMYSSLSTAVTGLDQLVDTGDYSVKYITTGGYPSFEYGAASVQYIVSSLSIQSADWCEVRWIEPATESDPSGKEMFLTQLETAELLPEDTTTFVITYDGSAWKLPKGDTTISVTLADWGIQLIGGTPAANDAISVSVAVLNEVSNGLANKLLSIAASRGDCVALIDHTNNQSRELIGDTSVYYAVSNSESAYKITSNGEFGAMFTPWCNVTFNALVSATKNDTFGTINYDLVDWDPDAMPASFEYLMSLAYSMRNNASWLAVAGVSRGIVPNFISLESTKRLTNAIAESYQPDNAIAINPITNIKPYGYTIWGNRTLKNNAVENGLTATSFLNIRNMVSDIKKSATTAAKRCIFEQNTDILWINFKAYITPLLDQMTSGYGLSGYRIIKNTSPSPVKIVATIRIYPTYAVEGFDITIELSSDTING